MEKSLTFASMYISKAKKYRHLEDGSIEAYDYYRLTKEEQWWQGESSQLLGTVFGALKGFTKVERNELADMLTVMIE